jgi:hypothetical protein
MIARQFETEAPEAGDEPLSPTPRLREQMSPIGHLLSRNLLDEAVRALQEDLALLQAEQQRGLRSLGGTLEQLGKEFEAVRCQLAVLTEPLLVAHQGLAGAAAESDPERVAERTEVHLRFERLEKQVALLMRGMDAVDGLRYQSEVHTRALARLTDLITEVVKPRPPEGLLALEETVQAMERAQRRAARFQLVAASLLGLGLTPGLAALVWLLLRANGF